MKIYYHATRYENLVSILNEGIRPSADGLVYMCTKEKDAIKFPAVLGVRDILVLEIKIPKSLEKLVSETFDHSETFYKCRAYGYSGVVIPSMIGRMWRYNI